jgi:putative signal transducing protein
MEHDTDTPELVEVLSSIDPTPVQIACDLLEGVGIECFVFDADSSRLLGTTPAVPTRLMVRHEVADDARQRLKELGLAE